MKNLTLTLSILLSITLFFSACKKEPQETCTDGVKNQTETDVDCGGTCTACPTCTDGIKNQDETDVDCGGATCPVCETCSDGIKNQDETDIDCGGKCAACPTPTFKSTCDGMAFTATSILCLNSAFGSVMIDAKDATRQLQVYIDDVPSKLSVKTYTLTSALYDKDIKSSVTTDMCSSNIVGTVTLTKVDQTKKRISGTFTFGCKYSTGSSSNVTSGSFSDIKIP